MGRITAGILVAHTLLLPVVADAAEPFQVAQATDVEVVDPQEVEELKRRVAELEHGQAAHADATRWIIRDAISTLGSKINEFVTLGGTLEVLSGEEGMDGFYYARLVKT